VPPKSLSTLTATKHPVNACAMPITTAQNAPLTALTARVRIKELVLLREHVFVRYATTQIHKPILLTC
jgi:hypothetical protein